MMSFPIDPSTKHARKIYVGNLPPDATEATLISFFNETINSLLPNKPAGTVVIGFYLNAQRRFGFLEHRSIEEANFTLGLDGISYNGANLKLRRPQDYNAPLAEAQLQMEMQAKGGQSSVSGARHFGTPGTGNTGDVVEDSPNKVFIGGLPHHLGEAEIKGILSSFGALKAFHLVKSETEPDKSKGFAFCEWRDSSTTDMACQALNGTKIGDRVLNVRRAVPHAEHKASSGGLDQPMALGGMPGMAGMPGMSGMSGMAGMSGMSGDLSAQHRFTSLPASGPNFSIGNPTTTALTLRHVNATIGPPPPATSAIGRIARVLGISNMIMPEADGAESQRIIEAATSECGRVGQVRSVEICHASNQVLVEFSSTKEAVQAMKSLQGRQFDGRLLNCTFAEATEKMKMDTIRRIIDEVEALEKAAEEKAIKLDTTCSTTPVTTATELTDDKETTGTSGAHILKTSPAQNFDDEPQPGKKLTMDDDDDDDDEGSPVK
eukprot:Selendium_serpulae@DN5323_c0_g1_i2.p1